MAANETAQPATNGWVENDLRIARLREMAKARTLTSETRQVLWMLLLTVLPATGSPSDWQAALDDHRRRYARLAKSHLEMDPRARSQQQDLSVANPLSLAEDSPWNQYFKDGSLYKEIDKDVKRIFPDEDYFSAPRVRTILHNVLFVWAKENPQISYVQGLHDLLGVLLMVVDSPRQQRKPPSGLKKTAQSFGLTGEPEPVTVATVMESLLDPAYSEHDAYALFSSLMMTMGELYHKAGDDQRVLEETPIADRCAHIFDKVLRCNDPTLYAHLTKQGIVPTSFLIKWVALLFAREFPLNEVLVIWDTILADDQFALNLVDGLCVALLQSVRETLLAADQNMCLVLLMRPIAVTDLNALLRAAIEARDKVVNTDPALMKFLRPMFAPNTRLDAAVRSNSATHQQQQRTPPPTVTTTTATTTNTLPTTSVAPEAPLSPSTSASPLTSAPLMSPTRPPVASPNAFVPPSPFNDESAAASNSAMGSASAVPSLEDGRRRAGSLAQPGEARELGVVRAVSKPPAPVAVPEAKKEEDTTTTWVRYIDETHNLPYYYNASTEITVWEKPTSGRIVDENEREIPPHEGEEWYQYFDETHRCFYYFNPRNNETRWLEPAGATITRVDQSLSSVKKDVEIRTEQPLWTTPYYIPTLNVAPDFMHADRDWLRSLNPKKVRIEELSVHLNPMFKNRQHPIGAACLAWSGLFQEEYRSGGNGVSAGASGNIPVKERLALAKVTMKAFKRNLTQSLTLTFPQLNVQGPINALTIEVIENGVYALAHPALAEIFYEQCADDDAALKLKYQHLSHITPGELGIRPVFIAAVEASSGATDALRRVGTETTPSGKLAAVVDCCTTICRQVSNYGTSKEPAQVAGDDLLAIFSYVVIHAAVEHLSAYAAMMDEFITASAARGEAGYSLATLQSAIMYVVSLDHVTLGAVSPAVMSLLT